MKKHYYSLLIVVAIAIIFVAGCTSPNQSNVAPANLTENASTSASTTTSSISRTSTSVASPSPSATVTSPSPTPTPVPSSGKIATSIYGNPSFYSDNTITRGSPKTTWAFSVSAQGKTLCDVPLTATIAGQKVGTLTSQAGPDCFATANYALSAQESNTLKLGANTLTISFAGDNTYQPTSASFEIDVT